MLLIGLSLVSVSRPAEGAAAGPAVLAFGDAKAPGDPTGLVPNAPIVGMAATPDGGGYWLVASDGGIFSFGDAVFHGSAGGIRLNQPIVGMAATPDGGGYWLVATDGGIFSFGDAVFHGSAGAVPLNRPITGMASTPLGRGYWLVATDGGIFSYGDAGFHGSAGAVPLNRPITGMASTPDGGGYWLVASDGGIFTYGDAPFRGSAAGALGANRVAAGIQRSPTGQGYTVLAVAGGIRVGFAGDVHGVGRVGAALARGENPLDALRPLLAANDINIVNLETAVGSKGVAQDKQYTFHSPPELVYRLREAGVSVVNLANNHSLDFGTESLLETISDARNAGLLVVGAGANASEAYSPAIVTTPRGTVALLGISQVVPAGWAAGPGRPGVASAYDLRATTDAVRAARARADHVVVMIHAGVELDECPSSMQHQLAGALLDAGAEAVVGGHPHVLQGIELGNGRLVDYSMGDFVWYQNNPPADQTGLLSVLLAPEGAAGYGFTPARVDDNGSPQPLTGQPAADARAHLDSLAPGAGRC
ncbi:MAG: hypothetical protein QOG64_2800 [Acidimicrobiaceae bacterium]|nr:hypothetical protein [Acidimicrobiaceae bacterium]